MLVMKQREFGESSMSLETRETSACSRSVPGRYDGSRAVSYYYYYYCIMTCSGARRTAKTNCGARD